MYSQGDLIKHSSSLCLWCLVTEVPERERERETSLHDFISLGQEQQKKCHGILSYLFRVAIVSQWVDPDDKAYRLLYI